jgi:hypothetical protein
MHLSTKVFKHVASCFVLTEWPYWALDEQNTCNRCGGRVAYIIMQNLTDYLERNPQLLRLETLLSTIYHIDASGAQRCCNSIYLYASVLSPSVSCYTADDHSGNGLTCVSLQLGQLNSSTLRW